MEAVKRGDPATAVVQELSRPKYADFLARNPAVFALGKAACQMAEGAERLLPNLHGFVVGQGKPRGLLGCEVHVGTHPEVSEASLRLGERMLGLAAELPWEQPVLCLVSGGGSAMVEALHGESSLHELQDGSASIMREGGDIARLNAFRVSHSRFKGGGLLRALLRGNSQRRVHTLVVSDVPNQCPELVSSGPTAGGPLTVISSVTTFQGGLSEVLANHGLKVHRHPERLAGEARVTGLRFLKTARALLTDEPRDQTNIVLAGGETAVTVTGFGIGGRNQEFVLGAADAMGTGELLFSFATDGDDGPSGSAGAFIDLAHLRQANSTMDAASALEDNNADAFFRAAQTRFELAPTGTNVGDVAGYIRWPRN